MNTEILTSARNPRIYVYTEPQYLETLWQGVRQGKGLVKVGYTQRDVQTRIAEQFPTNKPNENPYSILLDELAIRDNGTFFKDYEVHKALESMGAKRFKNSEWFEATIDEVRQAIKAIKTNKSIRKVALQDFKMRPEQNQAVEVTSKYFLENSIKTQGKTPHFLWNAKMRFGKTFTTYKLAEKMGWNKILILTFKPAVKNAWQEDLQNHQDFQNWQFLSSDTLSFGLADKSRPIVYFASFQDILGRNNIGSIKLKNEDIHTTNWNCIVFDEYHFGAWRDRAKGTFEREDEEPEEKQAFISDEEDILPITTNAYLYLSGTPFRAISSGEFLEDQIFNWTYSDEQNAKELWAGDDNPYIDLPQMVLMTYQMPEEIRKVALKGEFNEFDLNEFFATSKDLAGDFYFKHEESVLKWLDVIRGQYIPSEEANLKQDKKPPMPFSDKNLLSASHTLWFMNDIGACKAMAKILQSSNFYSNYKVNVCAGIEAGIGVKALAPVKEAIGNGFNTQTITLTCGKLTTGVSVPQWGAMFMLRNTTSPETYFQAAFRVQTPWKLRNPDGLSPNEVQIIKEKCYVYDFAPDRALMQIADYSASLDINSTQSPESKVKEFIHFLPVLCYDGYAMKPLNANDILDFLVSGTASTMLARRWESALLVNVDNATLEKILNNQEALEVLEKIEGFRNLNQQISAILNKSDALKKLKAEKADEDKVDKKEKKEVSDKEKEIKSLRKKIQEKLLKFATRIPIFMYLTDYREQTLKDIITKLEPNLFKKVTGLDISDFELLVSVGVFNSSIMNQAIFAFKRYEDASLSYTGLFTHNEQLIGGWDTVATLEEIKAME